MKLSPNQVSEELTRIAQNNYHRLVKRVMLHHVRGIREQTIEFRYPVTALIGTNGGGKSTILGSVALAYKNVKPAQFFPKAFRGDETMADWFVEYELIDKQAAPQRNLARTARFAQSKWRRNDFLERPVEYIEIQRTVPAGELAKYRKFIGAIDGDAEINELSQDTIIYAGAVLDKDVTNYRTANRANDPDNKIYIYESPEHGYSQFHFGAGEASIIATIDRIENCENNSLVLIEEVENGLHPVAVRLFVQYLQHVARRKRLQIIFTTHSQDAVDELPAEAIWATINRHLFNGQLSVESLRTITGQEIQNRIVFVEDDFVCEWVKSAIGWHRPLLMAQTRVEKAGGYPNLITVCEYHNRNPIIDTPAVALVDGDVMQDGVVLPDCARFIGEGVPESIVFDFIFDNRVDIISLIRQRCLLAGFSEQEIIAALEGVRNAAVDPHVVFTALSERLGFHSALHIRSGFIDLFNERNAEFWGECLDFVEELV
ncbi:ATP-dependent nuclease [Sulfitobacter pontiacus]|uniref:ATP-dependent nuclease n=1 Tax=Sulfitobacter pontiacus TaxID=60137 RepID=UPI0030ECB218